ncbi:SDR family NAD(P)-dependent oxidoreductase [Streptomyces abikoensis]|uniref:SDR family NAD(P)-dependent oxidoreductase n=1 Tax=Streptomyces abikoensis TaxID=97398 RepID=UPI0037114C31
MRVDQSCAWWGDASVVHTVIGVSPFGEPDARIAAAVCAAGGLGVLDLGRGDRRAREALGQMRRWAHGAFGVRVPDGCALRPEEVLGPDAEAGPRTVLLAPGVRWPVDRARKVTVLAEARSLAEARAAVRAGAAGVIGRGSECGGPTGELSTYVLLQQLLAAEDLGVPVWACGGIGPRTAAAAAIAGAAGVVLDVQLALLAEAATPSWLARLLRSSDGTGTTVLDGRRVLDPGHPALRSAPRGRAVPFGQDAFLAERFARDHRTAAVAVRALRAAVDEALRDPGAPRLLRPGSAMSRALGTTLPVVQGPMTRVSDQARFAAAVADEGGLPVVALALAGPGGTRSLLKETGAALGGRPWGVGILGFAPEPVRAAQLEAVRELRPSHAVLAGGHPAQAAALEALGIRTFLQAPSPGLLGQFLAAGARRFVFEGAECGGHIGPRNAFPHWEAQLGVLTDFLAARKDDGPAGVEVLFAGGVHDARSAAMVAALSSGLTERGVAVGLLMGTAYLFSREAVECGAVRPLFQRTVAAAERTVLLDAAPGHVIRCAPSPYTDAYAAHKEELRREGISGREAWERLERLNIGRLRVASKGVERVGEALREVDERRQSEEGLFMAGEVAVLRQAVTTVAELHRDVTDGAAAFYERRSASPAGDRLRTSDPRASDPRAADRPPVPEPLDVAIVGMACMFPGAPDLPAFWANVLGGADAVTEVPASRWDPALHHGEGARAGDVSASKWGGFLPGIAFDPLRYGIPPASLASVEPVQLLALEAARRALADAGYEHRAFPRDRTCVVFGAEAGSDLSHAITLRTVLPSYLGGRLPKELEERLPRLTEDSFPGMLANVVSGRIANRLGLGGANFTVDAACASSLAALDAACKELVTGAADVALCGGADLHNGINDYLLFSSVRALSPTGRCRTFDADADGIALGEGVACLVLKRLADARRAGDRVYAVVKGVGSSSDGRSLGLTAPRPEGQRTALERAYAQARISPARVGLLEAHGTGTAVGDRTELGVLSEVFAAAGAEPGGCVAGSVKSQIGHTKCAAGLAGLIKTALALHTGVRPPTLHLRRPDPAWRADSSPFVFHDRALPWAAEPAAARVAGVSAFGFGGTNYHVVLEGGDDVPPRRHVGGWPAELFLFRGDAAIEDLLRLAETNESHAIRDAGDAEAVWRPWRLRDLALTAAHRAADTAAGPVTAAVVASSPAELPGLLRAALAGRPGPGVLLPGPERVAGETAFLFPGQGSQRPGMLAELFVAFPETRRHLRGAPVARMFPPAAFGPDEHEARRRRLADTRNAQPALGAACLAVHDVLAELGIRPAMAAGHSYGELVALCAAGVFPADALPELSALRAAAMAAAAGDEPGTMAAVPAGAAEVEAVLEAAGLAGRVVVAARNSPAQTVVSGPEEAVRLGVAALEDAGLGARRLDVACAFHSPVMEGAADAFGAVLAERPFRAPEFPVWSNETAAPYPADATGARARLTGQITAPVRFAEQIEAMYEAGARVFVEAGPGTALTGLVRATLGDRPHLAVPFEPHADAGLRGHLESLARLAVSGGVPVDAAALFAGRDAVVADPERLPERPGWIVDGHLVRTAEGAFPPGALRPARSGGPGPELAAVGRAASAGPGAGSGEALLREFLRGSREAVAAQRDVLLAYLGDRRRDDGAVPVTVPERVPAVADVPAASGGRPAADRPDVLGTVLSVISERTGYPREMIEPHLDLEADLSVDSIKRTEIAGELVQRLARAGLELPSAADTDVEALARARTAAEIAEWLTARAGERPASAPSAVPAEAIGTRTTGTAPGRYVLRSVPLDDAPAADGSTVLRDSRFLVLDNENGPLAEALAERLRNLEARVTLSGGDTAEDSGRPDGVIHLVGPGEEAVGSVLPDTFPRYQELLRRGPRWLLCVRRADPGDRGDAGLGGFFRTVAREYPGTTARVVSVPREWTAAQVVDAVLGELLAPDRAPVVERAERGRRLAVAEPRAATPDGPVADGPAVGGLTAVGMVAHGLAADGSAAGRQATDGQAVAGPAANGSAADVQAAARPANNVQAADGPVAARQGPGRPAVARQAVGRLGLGPEAVVLFAGGARGIGSRFAVALTAASGCRVELLGRTGDIDAAEPPGTAGVRGRAALRAALAAHGRLGPAGIEREVGLITARRGTVATLDRIRAAGGQAGYRTVDLRDAEAVEQAVKETHARHGRIDGVVYAAGIVEDKLIADKDPASFRRVYETKAEGARALLTALRRIPEPPRFVVLFGSVAAVSGNRGQADYAAANDALAVLGRRWRRATGARALTVHWGPWAPDAEHGGMVGPELAREYARRGIGLIAPEEGVAALLGELAWGDDDTDEVVHAAPGWQP